MKSIYDIIVEDLGSKKAWGNLVYQVIGRDRYEDLTYGIKVAAAKTNIETGQKVADNGQPANTYPEDWLRTKLNAEFGKLGLNVRVKQKTITRTPLDLLEELVNISTTEKSNGDGTLSRLGKDMFYDRHAFRVFYHILKLNVNNGYEYVTEQEIRKSIKNKQMRSAVCELRKDPYGWEILNIHGLGYKVGLRHTKLGNPVVKLVNKIVSSIK